MKKAPGGGPAPGGRTEPTPPNKEEPVGALQPIAAKVLMKILYAARMARFDLLRAVNHLACYITKWTVDCDRRLHRLVHATKHHRMVGWVGDPFDKVGLHLFADADFAGCTSTKRSASGYHLQLQGPSTWFPLSGVSKRQACVSHSTPEAELVAATFALRHCGLPALVLWDSLLSPFVTTQGGRNTSASRGARVEPPKVASASRSADDPSPTPHLGNAVLTMHDDNTALIARVRSGCAISVVHTKFLWPG